eukprot:TRINITY_DN4354_c6_g1_i1.p1 TRINITY_DN4354_c6_g1~~TRINITY_DN4354_c6_g1_i1.p1  ORF type:complete len:731 (+),score=257.72 TRINITY_DN4354_c6_g1_i1:63-2255(+)
MPGGGGDQITPEQSDVFREELRKWYGYYIEKKDHKLYGNTAKYDGIPKLVDGYERQGEEFRQKVFAAMRANFGSPPFDPGPPESDGEETEEDEDGLSDAELQEFRVLIRRWYSYYDMWDKIDNIDKLIEQVAQNPGFRDKILESMESKYGKRPPEDWVAPKSKEDAEAQKEKKKKEEEEAAEKRKQEEAAAKQKAEEEARAARDQQEQEEREREERERAEREAKEQEERERQEQLERERSEQEEREEAERQRKAEQAAAAAAAAAAEAAAAEEERRRQEEAAAQAAAEAAAAAAAAAERELREQAAAQQQAAAELQRQATAVSASGAPSAQQAEPPLAPQRSRAPTVHLNAGPASRSMRAERDDGEARPREERSHRGDAARRSASRRRSRSRGHRHSSYQRSTPDRRWRRGERDAEWGDWGPRPRRDSRGAADEGEWGGRRSSRDAGRSEAVWDHSEEALCREMRLVQRQCEAQSQAVNKQLMALHADVLARVLGQQQRSSENIAAAVAALAERIRSQTPPRRPPRTLSSPATWPAPAAATPQPSSSKSTAEEPRRGRRSRARAAPASAAKATAVQRSLSPAVAAWLASLGLGHLSDVFAEHEVDSASLYLLREPDLEQMGIPVGPRKTLARSIRGAAARAAALFADRPASPERPGPGEFALAHGATAHVDAMAAGLVQTPWHRGRAPTWEQHVDPATGRVYYHCPETGESQWQHPAVSPPTHLHRRPSV